MCSCLEESTKKTGGFLKGKINDIHEVLFCDYECKSFLLNEDKLETVLTLPFKVEYYRKKKDGNPERKITRIEAKILPTYCPFCGVKLKNE